MCSAVWWLIAILWASLHQIVYRRIQLHVDSRYSKHVEFIKLFSFQHIIFANPIHIHWQTTNEIGRRKSIVMEYLLPHRSVSHVHWRASRHTNFGRATSSHTTSTHYPCVYASTTKYCNCTLGLYPVLGMMLYEYIYKYIQYSHENIKIIQKVVCIMLCNAIWNSMA